MIPAVGALVITIAALRSKSWGPYRVATSGEQPEAVRITESETAASPFRGIAIIFAVCAFLAVCCLSLFGRSLSLKIMVGGKNVDKLDELLPDHVQHVALRSDLEERPRVNLGDLFH